MATGGLLGTATGGVLGASRAAKTYNDIVEREAAAIAKRRLEEERAKAAAQAKANENWNKNRLQTPGGRYFQQDVSTAVNDVVKYGADLRKRGIDPYNIDWNNPQQVEESTKYLDMYDRARAMGDLRKNLEADKVASDKLLASKPQGYYDPESVEAINKFYSGGTSLSDIYSGGITAPQLRKQYNFQEDFLSKINPAVTADTRVVGNQRISTSGADVDRTRETVEISLLNNPEARGYVERQIGVPLNSLPQTSNKEQIKIQLDEEFRSNPETNPRIAELAQAGITSFDDDKYKTYLDEQATLLSDSRRKYDRILSSSVNAIANTAKQGRSVTNDFSAANEARNIQDQAMQRQNFQNAQEKHKDWKNQREGVNRNGEVVFGAERNVPTYYYKRNADGTINRNETERRLEKGAGLFTSNIPVQKVIVSPSEITNTETGETRKNSSPMEFEIGSVQYTPVFNRKSKSISEGSEMSAKQLRLIMEGKMKDVKPSDILFKAFAYGTRKYKDKDNEVRTEYVKIPYESAEGALNRKNTQQFNTYVQQIQEAFSSDEWKAMSNQEKLNYLKDEFKIQE